MRGPGPSASIRAVVRARGRPGPVLFSGDATGDANEEHDEQGRRGRRQAAAYQGAAEAVFAILIGGGIGYWADARFDTGPRYLLVGIAVGFCSFVLRLVRLGRRLQQIDEEPGQQQ